MNRFLRKPAILDNFGNFFQHFGKTALLLVGVVAIAGLVAATFIYGDQRREVAQNQNQDQSEETAAPAQNTNPGAETGDPGVVGDTSQGSSTTGSMGSGTSDQSATNGQPQRIPNTGGALETGLAAFAMAWLALIYRRSTKQLRALYTQA